MLGRGNGENLSHTCGAGKVYAPHGAMGDEGLDNRRSAGGIVSQDVDYSVIEPSLAKDGSDQAMRGGANLRCLENNCISAGQGNSDGADSENHGSVPGCDSEDDADRFPDRERQTA